MVFNYFPFFGEKEDIKIPLAPFKNGGFPGARERSDRQPHFSSPCNGEVLFWADCEDYTTIGQTSILRILPVYFFTQILHRLESLCY